MFVYPTIMLFPGSLTLDQFRFEYSPTHKWLFANVPFAMRLYRWWLMLMVNSIYSCLSPAVTLQLYLYFLHDSKTWSCLSFLEGRSIRVESDWRRWVQRWLLSRWFCLMLHCAQILTRFMKKHAPSKYHDNLIPKYRASHLKWTILLQLSLCYQHLAAKDSSWIQAISNVCKTPMLILTGTASPR